MFGGTVCFQGSTGIVGPDNPWPSQLTIGQLALIGGIFKASGNITVSSITVGSILKAGCSPEVVTVTGDVTYGPNGKSEFELGAPGPFGNDQIIVIGNLTNNGSLDILAQPGFAAGNTHALFTRTGNLVNHGVTLGATPAGFNCSLSFATPGQVNLVVSPLTPFISCPGGTLRENFDSMGPTGTNTPPGWLPPGISAVPTALTARWAPCPPAWARRRPPAVMWKHASATAPAKASPASRFPTPPPLTPATGTLVRKVYRNLPGDAGDYTVAVSFSGPLAQGKRPAPGRPQNAAAGPACRCGTTAP